MPDYITRQEFEEAIAALRCVGDQQTIDVTQSPGGQEIRSIQVITEEAPSDTDYVSVSYDSVAEEFTVTVTSLPVVDVQPVGNANTGKLYNSNQTVSGTMVFDKPASGLETLTLYAGHSRVASGGYKIFWDGSSTTTDAETTAVYAENGYGNRFASININDDGTFSITYQPAYEDRIVVSRTSLTPLLWVSKADTTIRLNWIIDPFDNDNVTYTLNYTPPFDDDVILGFTNNSVTLTLDSLANNGSYANYIRIGEVKIASGGDVEKCLMFSAPLAATYGLSLGFTGTGSYSTLRIVNGRIVNAT